MRARSQFAFLAVVVAAFGLAAAWAGDDPARRKRITTCRRLSSKMQLPGRAKAAPKEAAPPPSVTIIGAKDAHGVLGRDVRSHDRRGHGTYRRRDRRSHRPVRAAVIDFGGFLGVGSRKIVVDWNALHFGAVANKGDSITLELTKDQVKAAPEYKEDAPIVVLGASGTLLPLQFDP